MIRIELAHFVPFTCTVSLIVNLTTHRMISALRTQSYKKYRCPGMVYRFDPPNLM